MAAGIERQSLSTIQRSGGGPAVIKSGVYPKLDPQNHFAKSYQDVARVPTHLLRAATRTIPVQRAIQRISSGVIAMPWYVNVPADKDEDPKALEKAKEIENALRKPNRDEHNTYSKFIRAAITDLIALGFAAIERQPGKPGTQPFWLWIANGENIRINPDWTANKEGVMPRYYDYGHSFFSEDAIPLLNKDLFLIQSQTNSYELIPPSPLEIAFPFLCAWMSLGDFQSRTTGRAQNEFIIDLGDINQAQLEAFREYWREHVVKNGETPLVAGKGQLKIEKLGASSDAGLYLQFTDYLLKGIALAFGLTPRDYNITEHDNRATAGVAADSSFADAVLPIALTIQEQLDLEVVEYYCEGYHLKYSDTEPRTEQQEAETAGNLFKNNVITRNEARMRVGEKSLGIQGDVFSDKDKLSDPDAPRPPDAAIDGNSGSVQEGATNNKSTTKPQASAVPPEQVIAASRSSSKSRARKKNHKFAASRRSI